MDQPLLAAFAIAALGFALTACDKKEVERLKAENDALKAAQTAPSAILDEPSDANGSIPKPKDGKIVLDPRHVIARNLLAARVLYGHERVKNASSVSDLHKAQALVTTMSAFENGDLQHLPKKIAFRVLPDEIKAGEVGKGTILCVSPLESLRTDDGTTLSSSAKYYWISNYEAR